MRLESEMIKEDEDDEESEKRRSAKLLQNADIRDRRIYYAKFLESQEWPCPICAQRLRGLKTYTEHMIESHDSPDGCVCPTCGKREFKRKDHFRAHLISHHEPKSPCVHCGKLFGDGFRMRRHVNEVHLQRRLHSCPTCHKSFSRPEKLRAHLVVHDQARFKAFLCHLCGKAFKRSEHANRHQRTCNQKTIDDHEPQHPNVRYESQVENRAELNSLSTLDKETGISNQHHSNNSIAVKVEDGDDAQAQKRNQSTQSVEESTSNGVEESSSLPDAVGAVDQLEMEGDSNQGENVEAHLDAECDPLQDSIKVETEAVFRCMECKRGFRRQERLIRHVMKKHASQIDALKGMKREEDEENKIEKANVNMEDTNECSDPKSLTARGSKTRVVYHLDVSLRLSPMGCLDCNEHFCSIDELMDHFKKKHLEVKEKCCPIASCSMTFSSEARLRQHVKVGKHNQPCPQCGKTFKRLDKLEMHLRSHSTHRPYVCHLCEKSYKDSTSLQFHIRAHQNSRPYVCDECGQSFLKSDHLKRHRNGAHLGIKSVKCSFCDALFHDKHKAKVHERIHTGELPFLCSCCPKAFRRKESLEQHLLVHCDAPKLFKCYMCDASFASKQYLRRHVARHSRERAFKCVQCSKAFKNRRDLKSHSECVHKKMKRVICTSCNKSYKSKQGLANHLRGNALCNKAGKEAKKDLEQHKEDFNDHLLPTTTAAMANASSTATTTTSSSSAVAAITTSATVPTFITTTAAAAATATSTKSATEARDERGAESTTALTCSPIVTPTAAMSIEHRLNVTSEVSEEPLESTTSMDVSPAQEVEELERQEQGEEALSSSLSPDSTQEEENSGLVHEASSVEHMTHHILCPEPSFHSSVVDRSAPFGSNELLQRLENRTYHHAFNYQQQQPHSAFHPSSSLTSSEVSSCQQTSSALFPQLMFHPQPLIQPRLAQNHLGGDVHLHEQHHLEQSLTPHPYLHGQQQLLPQQAQSSSQAAVAAAVANVQQMMVPSAAFVDLYHYATSNFAATNVYHHHS